MDRSENTVDSFIAELADQILSEHDGRLQDVTVVFPNRRAGLFFRKALAQQITKPLWMPEVISMEDFVTRLSPLQKIEKLEAIFALFEVYKIHQKREESFDQFFFWGEMILRDFEEIDQYLVNTEQLFTSIKTQKELDEEFYFLDEEDKAIIQKFWATFLPKTTKSQEAFLETWKLLKPIYDDFQAALIARGEAYGGLIYREVARELPSLEVSKKPLYFAGFNALTFAEEKIIKHFVFETNAKVIWDVDRYYFDNEKQEAGFFLREYAKEQTLQRTFPEELPYRLKSPKEFKATGVSLEVGQTKALAEELEKLAHEPGFEPEKTVIVLPMEHMLFPTLHAIPDSIDRINITMGYPLKDTPVFSLLESVLMLQHMRRESIVNGVSFYYKPLVELLEHPLVFAMEEKAIQSLIAEIKKRNLITLYADDLNLEHPIFKHIFHKPDDAFEYLLGLLKQLYDYWKDQEHDLEQEFISRFYEHIAQLKKMMGDRAEELSYDFLIKLFRRLARTLKIPFTGEPLGGLQIMGILETRNLDFENVFVLNMNEDSWPAAPRSGSFIPYNIRKAFDLPVHDHHDAIYAYLFYRLLQRAKRVHFYYNTVSEFNVNGEISRLVQQLEVESDYTLEKRILASPIKTVPPKAITIEKTPAVLDGLERYLEGYQGRKGASPSSFTPSAINTYLDCRLKFYFKYVARLYEPDAVQEEMDPMVFGNILHDTMELLYKQFKERNKTDIVQPQDMFWIKEGVDGAMNQAFVKHYGISKKKEKKFKLEGRSLIAADVLKKFIYKILDYDRAYAPFKILGLEATSRDGYSLSVPISPGGREVAVRIRGIIDRIDLKQGKVRVIDYKTGRDEKNFKSVESLVDRNDKRRAKAAFQVFFYSHLFEKNFSKEPYETIEPGLFNSRDLFSDDFEWKLYDKSHKTNVGEFRRYQPDFETVLVELLIEMYAPEVPFDQTEDTKKCGYCTYKDICGR
ncbi:PD-(D/E)XK nuclease family protein [Marinoscillum furvescens]|uniref:PD-(D/E)XK nuclease superfamily protein n=1 Tax=Marinoscillum furvescens DSM 4134 TaxID=1122208 RepID=A0A3D9KZ09_MARFU|nr:PD-(D/E)XK nuclease family protein [Marinoscillum furvescens]RED93206.1 PD-(D/E)XK nuclease superfamily protein [Marinoscillum furvescens DSM 4134]